MSNQDKNEEKFEFTPEGETLGYISLGQAEVLAMRTAGDAHGAYGEELAGQPIAFEVFESTETEDHYIVTLSFRRQGNFSGVPGREQLFISKEGEVEHRQVISLPKTKRPASQKSILVAAALALGVTAVIIGLIFTVASSGDEDPTGPFFAVVPTETPSPTNSPTPTQGFTEIPPVATSLPTPTPTSTTAPTPAARPTSTLSPTPTARVIVVTATPRPTSTPSPFVATATPLPICTPRPVSASNSAPQGPLDSVSIKDCAVLVVRDTSGITLIQESVR